MMTRGNVLKHVYEKRIRGMYLLSVSMGLTVSRQTAKNLTVNRQKAVIILLVVKRFQGLPNLTISAAHLGLRALKESL